MACFIIMEAWMNSLKNIFFLILFCISLTGFYLYKSINKRDESKVTNLLQTELAKEFTPDREIRIDLVEIPPNTTLEKHWHPGEEFHYYLEGEVEIKIEGESSIIGTPGKVGHVPFKKHHVAIAGSKGAKIIVFRVHEKGKPWRYTDGKRNQN